METSYVLYILTILLFPLGWLATNVLNEAKETREKRLEYRLLMLHSFLPLWFIIQKDGAPFTNPTFLPQLEDVRSKFLIYGKKDEIVLFEDFIKAIEKKDLIAANKALSILVPFVKDRIRKELKIL